MNPFGNLQQGNPPGVDAPMDAHPHLNFRWNSERAASSLPIENYKSNVDDFDAWIERFESAVALATNPATEARKEELCLKWLPLKLDDEALAILKQVPAQATYRETITSLKKLLIDPVEQYKWKAMKTQIKWDGKESFQALATRVKRLVDKFEKHLSAEDRIWAYFFRFNNALPDDYQEHIDITIPETARTIENAKDLALRIQMSRKGKEKKVEFTGAVYEDNSLHSIDRSMAKLAAEMEKITMNELHPHQDDYSQPPAWDDGYQASGGGYNSGYGSQDLGYQYQQGPFILSNPQLDAPYPQNNTQNPQYYAPNADSYGPDMQYNALGVKPWGSSDDQSGRGNSSQRRRSQPQSRGLSPAQRRTNCGSTNHPPSSNRRDIFKAAISADIESDNSDVDDATLNAYLESVLEVQARRAFKRARHHQGN